MRAPDNTHEIDGIGQVLVGNLGYLGRTLTHLNLQANAPDDDAFYFAKSAEEFASLDEAQLTAPRQADGSLPILTFMKLKEADKQTKFGAGK